MLSVESVILQQPLVPALLLYGTALFLVFYDRACCAAISSFKEGGGT